MNYKCTYCGGDDFFEGPSGGVAMNVLCANPECRHWFNLSPGLPLMDLKRVEPNEEERRKERMVQGRAAEDMWAKTYGEGHVLFAAGKSARDCIRGMNYNMYGFSQAAGDDIVRLAGWIDAAFHRSKES